ncbi:TPA: hypothetical protein MYO83_001611 [Klebsiella michiganensis]|nr:hypothetical protein [Klebsiella michiganensis]HCB1847113.1 hypothetical protein [Klebsiella oxytoca]
MKVNHLLLVFALLGGPLSAMAIGVTPLSPQSGEIVFVENNIDGDYFVSTGPGSNPVYISGPSRISDAMVAAGNGSAFRGIISTNQPIVDSSYVFDLWLDNAPVASPFAGPACLSSGCSTAVTDGKGVYGIVYGRNQAVLLSGLISDDFYQYFRQMTTGSHFSMTLNGCRAYRPFYDASSGERCKDEGVGAVWQATELTFTKGAHLRLNKTGYTDEVFINSDGVPTPGDGNTNCRVQIVGGRSGLACKMVSYNLQTNGANSTSLQLYPSLLNWTLKYEIASDDMQFSLNGSSWLPASITTTSSMDIPTDYYTLDDMKSSGSIYVFLSNDFFKKMVAIGLSDINSQDLFNFTIKSETSNGSGMMIYNFSTSNSLTIKPREFGISITSDDYSESPTREGYVGSDKPSLDFDYLVATTGKTAADEVQIKVTGPSRTINGRAYCIFSSQDTQDKVPFPAILSFTTRNGSKKTVDSGCDGRWHDMTDALWASSAWTDISGEPGVMNTATVKLSILMNEIISMRILGSLSGWYGEVSASGEVHVQAIWRDVQ